MPDNTFTNNSLYTQRLDSAIRRAAWAHEQANQHRKGTDIPYIIHPFGVMVIASSATRDEDILIACLMHDILEDVDSSIYSEHQMRDEFGDRVVRMVRDVTKDDTETNWHERSKFYLAHLENVASDEAVIVSAADKIHNLISIVADYERVGDELWKRFSTKSRDDQLWWYDSILGVVGRRNAPGMLIDKLQEQLRSLKVMIAK